MWTLSASPPRQLEITVTLRLYHDLAHLWPIISPPEEYTVEAAEWRDLIWSEFGWTGNQPAWDPRARLLDLGCGGGHLLSHFTRHFTTEAVDISPEMLEISKSLNPRTPFTTSATCAPSGWGELSMWSPFMTP